MPKREDLRARFERSGTMRGGALDLAIEHDGRWIGEIQTYVPPGRDLPPGASEVGIAIEDRALRGWGYGTEARAAVPGMAVRARRSTRVHMPTVPINVAMRTVLEQLGFRPQGTTHELGQEFVFYVMTREAWVGSGTA